MVQNMNEFKERRARVIEKLRSGDYRQGTGFLKRMDDEGPKFCPLGVMCEDYAKHEGGAWEQSGPFPYFFASVDDTGALFWLPHAVRDYYGFRTRDLSFVQGTTGKSIPQLNDTGATFEEIADLIEAEPEGMIA